MKYRIEVTRRAEGDIDEIVEWIANKSPQGAVAWITRIEQVLVDLITSADSCPLAPEDGHGDTEIRNRIFKTRRGKPYRILFTIRNGTVLIRHVRGPGQDLVPPKELRGPHE